MVSSLDFGKAERHACTCTSRYDSDLRWDALDRIQLTQASKSKLKLHFFPRLVNSSTLTEIIHRAPSHALYAETWLTDSQKKTQTHFADTHARVNLHATSKQLLVLWLAWRGLEASSVTACVCVCMRVCTWAGDSRTSKRRRITPTAGLSVFSEPRLPTHLARAVITHKHTHTPISQTYRCTETQTLTYTHYDSE